MVNGGVENAFLAQRFLRFAPRLCSGARPWSLVRGGSNASLNVSKHRGPQLRGFPFSTSKHVAISRGSMIG